MSDSHKWRRFLPRFAIGAVLVGYVVWIDPLLGDLAQSWALEGDAYALWSLRAILLVFAAVFGAVVWWGLHRRRNPTVTRGSGS